MMNTNPLRVIECDIRRRHIMSLYTSLMNGYIDEHKLTTFYGSQPISLMPESIVHIVERRTNDQEFMYNLTAKLDGTRMLLFLHPSINGNIVFIDRLMTFYEPIHDFTYTCSAVCLLDGEMYDHVFFVFDIIYYNGFICEHIFETRLRTLQELLVMNRDRFTDTVISVITATTKIHIVHKLYMEIKGFKEEILVNNDLYRFVCDYFSDNPVLKNIGLVFPLRFDGLIFTPRFTKYILADNWKYPGNILYKWKPVHHETIDFVLEKRTLGSYKQSNRGTTTIGIVEGLHGTNVPFLIDVKKKQYAIIEHNDDIIINSSNVYECRYDTTTKRFVVVRLRNDKFKHPNNLRTAKCIWNLLNNRVNIKCNVTIIDTMKKDGWCKICSCFFSTYSTHVQGKRHFRKIKQYERLYHKLPDMLKFRVISFLYPSVCDYRSFHKQIHQWKMKTCTSLVVSGNPYYTQCQRCYLPRDGLD